MSRSLLCLVAGLVASLVFVAPSHASLIVTTEANFSLTGTGTLTASDLEFTYSSGVLPPVPATIDVVSSDLTVTSTTSAGDVLTINFTPVSSGNITFTFDTPSAAAFLLGSELSGVTGDVTQINQESHIVSVTNSIPEPASMGLLGLALVSFFAYGWFKRPAAV